MKQFPVPLEQRIAATIRNEERRRTRERFEELRRDVERVRARRRRRSISNNAMVYLVMSSVDDSASDEAWDNSEFLALHERSIAIEREYGLTPDDYWLVDEGPPEWQALCDEWERRFTALQLQWLRELGFRDIANLWERDRDALFRRYREGHDEICGPVIEGEFERLVERIQRAHEQRRREHPLKDWRLGP